VPASALDAVDRGFRVILVENALCSSSDPGHDALMTLYRTRFSEQIEIIKAEEPSVWRERLVMKRRLPDHGTKGRRIHSSLQLFPNNAGRF
jgi:hypothetical protein